MQQTINALLPLNWVRAERYCELTGEPLNTVRDRASRPRSFSARGVPPGSRVSVTALPCARNASASAPWYSTWPPLQIGSINNPT